MSSSLLRASLGLAVVTAALASGCRTFENAGSSLDHGLRSTGQDIQHGIRGEPEPTPPAASTAQPARSAQAPAPPAAPSAPPPPTANGTSL